MNDLRFKGLKEQWGKVQEARKKRDYSRGKIQKLKSQLKSMTQLHPRLEERVDKELDIYNKVMV